MPQLSRPRLWVWPTIALAHLTTCYLCVQALSNRFYFSRSVVLLHVLLVGGVIALFVAAASYSVHRRWLTNRTVPRLLLSAAAAVAVSLLALLYLGDFAGNYFWGDNLNYQVAREYWAMALPDRAPFYLSPWVHAAALGLIVLSFAGYWAASGIFLLSIEHTLQSAPLRRLGRPASLAVAGVLVLAYGSVVSWLGWRMHQSQLLGAEPIVGFFLDSPSLLEFSEYAGDTGRQSEGVAIRAAYPRGQQFERKNVILIMVDSLRADHMGVYGYHRPTTPFLSHLSDTGRIRRVDLALSTCAETNCGVMSTLNSRQRSHLASGDFSLDQLLRDQGYDVYRLLSGDHNWQGLRQLYGNEQTLYFDSTNSHQYELNDDGVLFEALDRVPDYHGTPAFFQFHLMSVHSSGVRHQRYQQFRPSAVRRNLDWIFKGDDLDALTNEYDNGVLEADATIEEVFERLRQKGYLVNSLGVILSDHGEGLGERGPHAVAHMNLLYQEYIRIPLLIFDEANVSYGNLSLARQIDVAPTIVNRLGLAQPSSWEGHSLLDSAIQRYSYHQSGGQRLQGAKRWHGCYGVVNRVEQTTFKYLQCGDPPREELYDLTRDPSEKHDLSDQAPAALMEDLRSHLRDYLVRPGVTTQPAS